MKKFSEILKPFYSIIFGALFLLLYLNWLQGGGATLAMGIVAMIFSAYYLAIGIISVVAGDKLVGQTKRIINMLTICLFPLFMFVMFLISTINGAGGYGPNGWVIAILSMIASIVLVVVYAMATFVDHAALKNVTQLMSFVFLLALILHVVFTTAGNARILGNLNIVEVAFYFVYGGMLLSSLSSLGETEKPAPEQTPTAE